MKLAQRIEEVFTSELEKLGLACWVEITTANPKCTYYFGPFMNISEAETAQVGYIEDLQQEGSESISVRVKRCQPAEHTIVSDS